MTPTQEQLQAAIREHTDGGVSVQVVERALYKAGFIIGRGYNAIVEAEINDLYPDAEYEGGGCYSIPSLPATEAAPIEEIQTAPRPEPEPMLTWVSSQGASIRVSYNPVTAAYTVTVDGKSKEAYDLSSVPPKFAQAARAHGIVAMLGPVGVTSEQRDIVKAEQAKDRGGLHLVCQEGKRYAI